MPADFAIDHLFGTLRSGHSVQAALKGLQLRVRDCGAMVRTDPRLLQRVLGKLLANAIRYTDSGGVLLACRRRRGKLWAEVWDTGRGIAESRTARIFEEFEPPGDEERDRGRGLGLAIAAKTAALLGLEMRVRSRQGRGSMFAVELPPGQLGAGDSPAGGAAAGRSLKIALVEDNAMVIEALILALEGAGHEVIEATSGAALLERMGKDVPDIVIADYRLAGAETGFDVIAAARDIYGRRLPAILITGDTDPALVQRDGDTTVFYKPLQIEALLAFIGRAGEPRA